LRGSWLIIVKDFTRRARDPWSLLPILLLPIVIGGIMHLSFGGIERGGMPRAVLLLADEDEGLGSDIFRTALEQEQLADLIEVKEVTAADGRAAIDKGEASGFLVIPAGFTDSLVAGHPIELRLVRNPAQQFLPEIIEESLAIVVFIVAKGALVFEEPLQAIHEAQTGTGTGDFAGQTQEISSLIGDVLAQCEGLLFPPLVTLQIEELASDSSPDFPISALFFPALIPLSLFFLADLSVRDTIREHNRGTLHRIMTTPTSMLAFLTGKLAGTLLLGVVMFAVLAGLGSLVFKIGWGENLPELLVLVIGYLIAAAGIELMIYGFLKTELSAQTLSTIVVMLMGLVGGSIVPQQFFPPILEKVKYISIAGWVLQGFDKVLWKGATFPGIALELVVLTGCGIVTTLIGSRAMLWKLRRPAG
jgi:ABC-2 type transport system permease protein